MSKNVFHRSCVKRALFAVVLGLCIAGASSVATAAPTAYMEANLGELGTINLTTGATSMIGHMDYTYLGIGFGGSLGVANGNLYTTAEGSYYGSHDYGQLYSVNTTTGAATLVGSSGIYYSAFGSTTSGLYAIGSPGVGEHLYSINASTGAATEIGTSGVDPWYAGGHILSTNSASLYDAYGVNSYQLLSVNTTTGTETFIGDYVPGTSAKIMAMGEINGTLYGIGGLGAISTIDTMTGVDTPTGATASFAIGYYEGIYGLAPFPLPSSPTTVPVPPGIVLSGIGLFGLVGFRKKLKIS
jgi:hypothetical protein